MKHKKDSISSILLGDTLGDLASQLDIGDGNCKLLVILIAPGGVKVAMTSGITKPEAVGALHLAVENVCYSEEH